MELPSLNNQYRSKMPVKINKFKQNQIKEMKRKESIAGLKNINDHYTITHGYYADDTIK